MYNYFKKMMMKNKILLEDLIQFQLFRTHLLCYNVEYEEVGRC